MFRFTAYKENQRAPTARVAKIGGIYRLEEGLIKVTLLGSNDRQPMARVHLLWEPWDWLDSRAMVDFAMDQFKRGAFANGGPRPH